ncbi:MAG: SGNH/GDSL hydrolase family protein [Deltaproteobacteria bacterium]|nr:SGNH/GDSL hydrolase family protein [Deltaproteobacteria bacterium]
MLYFLGNCQMDFLSRAMAGKGHECEYRVLASPFTYASSPGYIPAELGPLARDLESFFHGRSLVNQFEMISSDDRPPRLVVMNLFHENSPLFMHQTDKYVFFVDAKSWELIPWFETWMKDRFGMIRGNPATYMKRYRDMLEKFLSRFPGVDVVVVVRLSHHPAFGPDPYSYLEGWGEMAGEALQTARSWMRELPGVHVVELDRLFAGIWQKSEKSIEAHCPFLKFTLREDRGRVTGVQASRDVEHIGSMWPVLADRLVEFMEIGRIRYRSGESVPEEWNVAWRPRRLSEDAMLALLSSGANYHCARAVGAFFHDLDTDYTELLVRTRRLTPVCHNTLHMIRTYGRVKPNPALGLWCRAHRMAAKDFTDNGPLYQEEYLQRLDEMERFSLGGQ